MVIPSHELARRISTLEIEIKTTHPKSSQLQALAQIEKDVNKITDRITDVTFVLGMGELVLGLVSLLITIPNKNLEQSLIIAGSSVTAYMGTFLLGTIAREFQKQKIISSRLTLLDKQNKLAMS